MNALASIKAEIKHATEETFEASFGKGMTHETRKGWRLKVPVLVKFSPILNVAEVVETKSFFSPYHSECVKVYRYWHDKLILRANMTYSDGFIMMDCR